MLNPKISIIVPVYKVEKYLERCLDSIIAQTFTDWECILVDDGSPDNCGKLCDDYAKKDDRFVVIHQENAGVSAARNAGLDIAKGDYITFVDSDDWVEINFLEEQYNDIVIDDYDVCICGFVGKGSKQIKVLSALDAKKDLFNIDGIGGFSFLRLIKRSILRDVRFDTSISYLEDTDFFYHLYDNCCKIKWTNSPLYNYFNNVESVTRKCGFTVQKDSAYKFLENLFICESNTQIKNLIFNRILEFIVHTSLEYILFNNEYSNESFLEYKEKIRNSIFYILVSTNFTFKFKIIALMVSYRKQYNKSILVKYLRQKKGI